MLIGMRNAMLAGGGLSAKSYVQDGLVAMWDGIENAGLGVHDSNATVWADLTGNGHDFSISTATFSNDCINISIRSASLSNGVLASSIGTIETSVKTRTSGYCFIFFNSRNRLTWNPSGIAVNPDIPKSLVENSQASTFSAIVNTNGVLSLGYADGIEAPIKNWTDWPKGENNQLSPDYGVYSFVGSLRFIRLYSRALTAAEVAANYAVDKARFNLP